MSVNRHSQDLPRFEALAARHRANLARALTGTVGKRTALLVIAAGITSLATIALSFVFFNLALTILGTVAAAGLFGAAYIGGGRLAKTSDLWMFADSEWAVGIAWHAGIDAAAATALAEASGQGGLTPDILRALSAVWTGAGLSTAALAASPDLAAAA